jgi:hypothetical protein
MQVIVPQASLTLAPDELVNIMMSFQDNQTFDPSVVVAGWTVFSVPNSAITVDATKTTHVLVTGWRSSNAQQTVSYEATARINAVFPDFSQRNANAELNGYITTYGADTTTWPAYQQQRKTEIDRCWTYVNSVRTTANTMAGAALPADPSDDSHWPTRVPPYVPS